MTDKWVLDATLGDEMPLAFCPIEGDEVMFGLTYVSDKPPGEFVGVVHMDGQEACEKWCAEHEDVIARLRGGCS